ncbi:carbohydrate kinase family protein [Jeongeupia sp. USM3]|uniref:carbohydrate kinase family protein n=1 Tax=Jeongeupia sp. USM3 TaxID=1906741 RepID=UPI00089DEB53|nr:carbohydrate kinase family protein [Jeongeupia sp. USM3]AOY01082.1 carbohydrate kinase family protein [Jeongeupia sp. USM3]
MSTLICGSVAYDTIMVFQDQFKRHILPDQIHMLSVSFLVPEMRREFGGCAGNIAYSLKLLGGDPLLMATVGSDFGPYAQRLDNLGIARTHVRELPEQFTAQCFVTTDLDDNQIAAFHPGAMGLAHLNRLEHVEVPVELAIIGPDSKQAMTERAEQLASAGIPFIFDLGQAFPLFDGDELRRMIELATYFAANDYEAEVISQRTGLSLGQIAGQLKALVVTRGAEGAHVYADGVIHEIPPVKAAAVVDPTGCGDAFRAGLLYGIVHGWDWPATGRLASLLGALKIAQRGAQNHRFTAESIAADYQAAFGAPWPGQ